MAITLKAINPFVELVNDKPQYYEYSHAPVEYKDFIVIYNVKGSYDVVKNGVCISQRVTQRAAKAFIDTILTNPDGFFWVLRKHNEHFVQLSANYKDITLYKNGWVEDSLTYEELIIAIEDINKGKDE